MRAASAEVWVAGPDRTTTDIPVALHCDPLEQRRRAYVADRDRAHRLRELAAGRYLRVPPDEVRMAREPNGRPFLPDHLDVDVNLSHAGGAVAVGVATGRRIGVDLEPVRPLPRADNFMRHAFSCAEWEAIGSSESPDTELLAIWTCKEALLKAIGVGLRIALRDVLTDADRSDGRLDLRLDPPLDPMQRRWSIWPLLAPSGFVGACAVSSDDGYSIKPTVRELDGCLPTLR